MALYDHNDFVGRLLRLFPKGWLPDVAPRIAATLQAPAMMFSAIFAMLSFVKAQQRVATAQGAWLDLIAQDYFGIGGLPRLQYESDAAYAARIKYNMTAPRGTLAGMVAMLLFLTGNHATVFRPTSPQDCGGGWSTLQNPNFANQLPATLGLGGFFWTSARYEPAPNYGGFGDGFAGAWGTLTMPAQVFITVPPPTGGYNFFADYGGFGTVAIFLLAAVSVLGAYPHRP